jgi:hypothetical protein
MSSAMLYRTKQAGEVPMGAARPAPTPEQFSAYQSMYDHFNRALFDGELPQVILNFSRRAGSLGFFAAERWDDGRARTHEISLNPAHLKERSPIDVASTLVHEMVHLWQQERGTPSRAGYHNAEWAEKMESVGLVPSDTGGPGGHRVGQQMHHYVADTGRFQHAFELLPRGCLLPWRCRPEEERGAREGRGTVAGTRNKVKYTCPSCASNVWGKPDLEIQCVPCVRRYLVAEPRR